MSFKNTVTNVEYYEKEFFKLNLSGSKLNISGLKEFPLLKNAEPNPNPELKMTPLGGNNLAEIYLDVNLDSLTLNKDMPLKQVALKAYRNGSLWQNLFLFAMILDMQNISTKLFYSNHMKTFWAIDSHSFHNPILLQYPEI